MNIAIDGPAGAGKSTVARQVAAALGSIYVDTGAMYRALALYVTEEGIDPSDEKSVVASLPGADIRLGFQDGRQRVFLNGRDVTGEIRTEAVTQAASMTGTYREVRAHMVALQQKLAAEIPVVMDGRDICSVVLPDAEVKLYLTASARERAKRRFLQDRDRLPEDQRPVLTEGEEEAEIARIEREIAERDARDMNRKESPLVQAPDAICVDTSDMGLTEVVEHILEIARRAGAHV